jgi:transglutaminase-like putative cysteine protease
MLGPRPIFLPPVGSDSIRHRACLPAKVTAWVSVYCSGFGWLDFDPTTDVMPSGSKLTVAWGRDYGGVTPVRGVAIGGGEQTIDVSVCVVPTLE